MNLKNKVAIVTGGSHGIGEAIVKRFSSAGANVLFTYKNSKEKAEEIIAGSLQEHGKIVAMQCDMSDVSCCNDIIERCIDEFGNTDILVNNVGILTRDSFMTINEDDYDRVLNTTLKVPFFLTQSVARRMITEETRGSIINISSLSARICRSRVAHYQIAKAGMENLTKSAAFELAEYGIRVNGICPGLTATNANREQWESQPVLWKNRAENIPLGRTGIPQDHAGAALFLASDEAAWVTGTTITIDGGMALY